jgi:hypothetical protein
LSTWCGIFFRCSREEISSDFSMLVVPTRQGWPRLRASSISAATASYFSAAER